MKVDLHTHSYFSDGTHSPQFVIDRARNNGVSHLALTDHDCLDGYLEAISNDSIEGIQLLPGVEISTSWENLEIHIIGLCVDPCHPELRLLLENQQQKRRQRIEEIALKLEKAGIGGLNAHILALPCTSPGRAHVARFLAGKTKYTSGKKAFKTLAKNGQFYVRPQWCELSEAINVINTAGGIAILAHPHRYSTNKKSMGRLVEDFCRAGGEAMEVSCSNMTPDSLKQLARMSLDFELLVSAGSDFHSTEATWMDIGKIRTFPESVKKNAIWTHPRWHSELSS